MTRTSSTKVQWRVQVRKSRADKWSNAGLFETRAAARQDAYYMRECHIDGVGAGNTRVVRYVKPARGGRKA